MSTTQTPSNTQSGVDVLKDAGVVTTLVDAGMEFATGRPKSGAILVGAAAVSTRVPGFGTAVSLFMRGYRRLT